MELMNKLKKFFKELWWHFGYHANPARYHMAEREEKWKQHTLKISHMCYEYGMDGMSVRGLEKIREYTRDVLIEMGYME